MPDEDAGLKRTWDLGRRGAGKDVAVPRRSLGWGGRGGAWET